MNYDILCIVFYYVNKTECKKMINVSRRVHHVLYDILEVSLTLSNTSLMRKKPSDNIITIIKRCKRVHCMNEFYFQRITLSDHYEHIRKLSFSDSFNRSIDCLQNMHLTHLHLGITFDKSIDKLPRTLTHLMFHNCSNFNKSVDNLPTNLKYISFGYKFNQSVDNLPKSLIYLKLGFAFNKSIDNLPGSIKKLKLGFGFKILINNLPKSLTYLSFGNKYNNIIPKLHTLEYLTHLIFGECFNVYIDDFPKSLKYLEFGSHYDKPIKNLPKGLCELVIRNPNYDVGLLDVPYDLRKLKVCHGINIKSFDFSKCNNNFVIYTMCY